MKFGRISKQNLVQIIGIADNYYIYEVGYSESTEQGDNVIKPFAHIIPPILF